MKEIRILSANDLESIKEFFSNDSEIILSYSNYFLNDERYRSFGLFVDNTLSEVISVIDNQEIPAYTISSLHSNFDLNNTELLNYVIDYHEQQKSLLQFFTLLTVKQHASMITELPRYQPYLEHKVMPGNLTNYENIDHDVMSYKTRENLLFIHLWVLKNECRVD